MNSMQLDLVKAFIFKIKKLINEDKLKNNLVQKEMLSINIKRMVYMASATFIVHAMNILQFVFYEEAMTPIEIEWKDNVLLINGINALIVLCFGIKAFRINKKGASLSTIKLVQLLFALDIILVGIVSVRVDQYVTTNITPFLVVCTVIGVFILNRPTVAVTMYIISYAVFYKAIELYRTEPVILLTNRVNGFNFISIGICVSIIMWYSYRTNILQAAKIKAQQKALEEVAFHDSLTGLYNRRRWLAVLEDELKRMSRYGHESSIILLDVDHFKAINDQYGHPAGDKVLEEIAEILKSQLRATDKAARWGGEEFILLLTQTSVQNAGIAAEKIRALIEKRVVESQNHRFTVTASFGVAALRSRELSFEETYNKVDQALYLAKQKGRNRVECAECDN